MHFVYFNQIIKKDVYKMKLSELIKTIDATIVCGSTDIDIDALTIDSRKAKAGTLFVCIYGIHTDGHKYIPSAFESGCRAVICERDVENLPEGITAVRVENSRAALAEIARIFYGDPSKKFNLIGVTGTNGKTSTTYFMESVLASVGRHSGVIGTVEIRVDGEKLPVHLATSTTPDTIELNELFGLMADKKLDDVVMEVSSHSLELKKVAGMDFDVAIFTNLTQDHLDFHGSMENYAAAKAKLFKMCKKGVVNIDDAWSGTILKAAECPVLTFGIDKPADVRAENIEYFMDKSTFDVKIDGKSYSFELHVPGRFSVYNALGVIAASLMMGISPEVIREGINSIKGVPGRIQNVPNDKGFNVIVDYAHTPDGVENILKSVREFTRGRIITVFGCGGDRDRTKRPIMGRLAAELGDISIITSDNPRSEEPMDILKEIEVGVKPITDSYEMIVDRREAIYRAVKLADVGDSVVIAGKGHEDYEIFKDKTIHFDDVEVAREALEDLD
jgi:UDP-N-acetylmuramoyl-L-alanyl-D-glutamate--2,6-diaminopimelate ligase